MLRHALKGRPVDVDTATDGAEAVRAAAARHYDLILMDLSLPQMDGWTATRHIKAKPELQHIKIIALTAHAMVGDREKALEEGDLARFWPMVKSAAGYLVRNGPASPEDRWEEDRLLKVLKSTALSAAASLAVDPPSDSGWPTLQLSR